MEQAAPHSGGHGSLLGDIELERPVLPSVGLGDVPPGDIELEQASFEGPHWGGASIPLTPSIPLERPALPSGGNASLLGDIELECPALPSVGLRDVPPGDIELERPALPTGGHGSVLGDIESERPAFPSQGHGSLLSEIVLERPPLPSDGLSFSVPLGDSEMRGECCDIPGGTPGQLYNA